MIRLQASGGAAAAPERVTLIKDKNPKKSVWIETLPISRAIRRRAKRVALARIAGVDVNQIDPTDLEDWSEAFTHELLRLVIVAWGGVLGEGDSVAEITPPHEVRMRTSAKADRPTGTIDDFLAIDEVFDAADRLVVMPIVAKEREKNASPASPSGTGGAGTRAKTIAVSPAARKRKGGAKSAPTG